MERIILKHLFPAFTLLLFTLSSLSFAREACYDCHGQKGMTGFVDRSVFEQSVHSGMACGQCHLGVGGYPHGKISPVNCGICHFLGREGAPAEQAREYKLSVHGRALASGSAGAPTCQTCHGSHYIFPSSDARSATNRPKIPGLCSRCHSAEFTDYRKSIHAKELLEKNNNMAPTCFDCHLEHLVPRTGDARWQLSLIRQCGACHDEEMSTYRKTYHGKVTQLGYATMAKCSDCHGSHGIVAVRDEASPLSKQNIVTTCRKCHAGATEGFTKYYAHAEESNREKYPLLYYTYIFMTTLLIGVFAFFFTHTFLWAYRSLKERMQRKGGE